MCRLARGVLTAPGISPISALSSVSLVMIQSPQHAQWNICFSAPLGLRLGLQLLQGECSVDICLVGLGRPHSILQDVGPRSFPLPWLTPLL